MVGCYTVEQNSSFLPQMSQNNKLLWLITIDGTSDTQHNASCKPTLPAT
jgi:hypothetical protein